ncbi:DUF2269 domain-containing protein [Sphingobium sp. WCS2017Hpa-17]|uniref:DUF2269 family protein n=1 Tax=Sphingobium sp. WCS2017Hpa-17 TaxID=3073638 RepID=UPI002889A53C|nr:DUF2269 domain-containing protein [Sphingobium sp. WCS2017Hpa-17]
MSDTLILLLRWTHVLGACTLIGTGAGIAFFMLMAHRSGDVRVIAHTARIVVIADMLFTMSAVIVQPISGVLLAHELGWPLDTPWIVASIGLYLLIGAFWLPVLWMQARMRDLAMAAMQADAPLPDAYHRLYRWWFAFGFPAFGAILVIVWLMLARPVL